MNRKQVSPTTGLNVIRKRKISCSYKESNHDASICSPLTTFTILSQSHCKPLMNWLIWGVSGAIMPIVQYSQIMCVCVRAHTHTHTHTHTEEVLNNTSYDSMCGALVKHGVDYTIVQWIRATLEGRLAAATLGGSSRNVEVSRRCPQGGVLSLFLWCLVVDNLIARLNGGYSLYPRLCRWHLSSSSGEIPKYGIRDHIMGPSYCRDMVWRGRVVN